MKALCALRPRNPGSAGKPVETRTELLSDPRQLLRAHRSRMDGLRLESGYGPEQFERLIESAVYQTADYAHFLPATRHENHSESGGLLRLALESACLAYRRAEGEFLTGTVGADVRHRERDRIWRYAVFLAALFRPLGRCVTALRVASGREVWNPYQESLWAWLRRVGASEIDLQWRDGVDARPERASSIWVASRIVPAASLAFLQRAGDPLPEVFLQLLDGAAAGRANEIIADTYQAVVDQDLLRVGRSREPELVGVAIEYRLLDALRGLIRERWTLNAPGGRLWATRHGVFLQWKAAANDIAVRLRAEGINGAPRDPDTVADLLVAHGVLVPNPEATGALKHYYRIVPHLRGVPKQPLEVVRIADLEQLGLRAEGVEAIDADLLPATDAASTRSEPVGTQHRLPLTLTPPAASAPATRAGSRGKRVSSAAHASQAAQAPSVGAAPGPVGTSLVEPSATASHAGPGSGPTVAGERSGGEQSETVEANAAAPATGPPEPVVAMWDGLARFGEAGSTFRALAERLSTQPDFPGVTILEEGIALAYPEAISPFCAEPQQFLMACESQGLLVRDGADGGRIVRSRRGRGSDVPERFIVLSPRIARYLPIHRSG